MKKGRSFTTSVRCVDCNTEFNYFPDGMVCPICNPSPENKKQ